MLYDTINLPNPEAGRLALSKSLETSPIEESSNGSGIVSALEDAYAVIQVINPELPDVVIITGTGKNGYGLNWGHFARDRWTDDVSQGKRPEMFVSGERLACGPEHVLSTMLHESAHALASVRGIDDTSRNGRYHNKKFKALAEELTLKIEGHSDLVIGFSNTEITDETRLQYKEALAALQRAQTLYLDTLTRLYGTPIPPIDPGSGCGRKRVGKKEGGKNTNLLKATCSCEPVRVIRASHKVLDGADITCAECNEIFTEEAL